MGSGAPPFDLDAALAVLEPCAPAVDARIERLPLKEPFRISDHVFETVDTLVVRLEADGCTGEGEAAGVYYLGDEPERMLEQVEAARPWLTDRLDHAGLHRNLPPGGARNALDCALWELQAQRTGKPVWQLLGMEPPRPLLTTFTIGADAPARMAATAIGYASAKALKIKLKGDGADADRISAVSGVRPDAWLAVDANRALTPASLEQLVPAMQSAGVRLLEQPFPVGEDRPLQAMDLPFPIAADESVQQLSDIDGLSLGYDTINIKLDKCGGLTEALQMAARARSLGLGVMVGNMLGSSLAMAPAYLIGQLCEVVDLDGPVFLREDRPRSVSYANGLIECSGVWGGF